MSNTLGIRRHIRSVGSIRQITKAMELTAAAKMHKASMAVLNTRPYATRALELARSLEQRGAGGHPLLEARPIKRQLCIVITSDRGMAGGLNNQLTRKIGQRLKDSDHPIDFIVIGKQGVAALSRVGLSILLKFVNIPNNPDSLFTRPISLAARDLFVKKNYDLVSVAYNHFQSTLTQVPTVRQLLPLSIHPEHEEEINIISSANEDKLSPALFEPDSKLLLKAILPRLVDHIFLQFLLEAVASEHAARMVSMRNATDNASDLLDDLKLSYNSIRQTTITAEMAEISASMTALS